MTQSISRAFSVVLVVVSVVVGAGLLASRPIPTAATPDFGDLDAADRKAQFFRWLEPVVARENARVEGVRRRLLYLDKKARGDRRWCDHERAFLQELAQRYKVSAGVLEPGPGFRALLRRVDTVPPRLVLAQAAVESGWGTSRFARDANNYFGIWTWRHAGLVPTEREAGANHTVAAYEDAAESVRVYLFTLDAGAVYSDLRRLRAEARAAGLPPRAYDLAAGLRGYSERGDAYVAEIRAVLRVNAELLDSVLEGT